MAERKEVAVDIIFGRTILMLLDSDAMRNNAASLAPQLAETLQSVALTRLTHAGRLAMQSVVESKRLSIELYAEVLGVLCVQRFGHILATIAMEITSRLKSSASMTQKDKREVLCHMQLLKHTRLPCVCSQTAISTQEVDFLRFIHNDIASKSQGWRDLKHVVCEVLIALLAPLASSSFTTGETCPGWDDILGAFNQKVLVQNLLVSSSNGTIQLSKSIIQLHCPSPQNV